jgi:hypothetical protein
MSLELLLNKIQKRNVLQIIVLFKNGGGHFTMYMNARHPIENKGNEILLTFLK